MDQVHGKLFVSDSDGTIFAVERDSHRTSTLWRGNNSIEGIAIDPLRRLLYASQGNSIVRLNLNDTPVKSTKFIGKGLFKDLTHH